MTIILMMTVMGVAVEPKIQDSDMCVCKSLTSAEYKCVIEQLPTSKINVVAVLDEDKLPVESRVKILCSRGDDEALVLE